MSQSSQSYLRGAVDRVVYQSAESDYTVLRVTLEDTSQQVVVVGNFASVQPGETVSCKGDWVLHPQYGRQFKAAEYELRPAQTVSGIQKYLSSSFVHGIGDKLAQRIVKRFGTDTLTILEKSPDRLAEVPGIGRKKLSDVRKALERQKGARAALIFLQEHGLGPVTAAKVFRAYGGATVAVIRENPYRMISDVSGVGFKTADRLAGKLGIDASSPFRIQAGVVHALLEATDDGHVYLPRRELRTCAGKLLRTTSTAVDEQIDQLVASRGLISEDFPDRPVYAPHLYEAEVETARKLRTILKAPPSTLPSSALPEPQEPRKLAQAELSGEQQNAIRLAVSEKCIVVTGGPGVGKTTTIRGLLALARRCGLTFLLCAPTGRAAKALSQIAGADAKTIHRLLRFNPALSLFEHNAQNPLPADLIVVDEASMIDILIMRSLLDAIPAGARLVLVGDVDQIPPVGPGNPLSEIIASGKVPVVRLTELFRQARESLIVQNAHRINRGKMPLFETHPDGDFYFIEQEDPDAVVSTVLQLCCERIPRRFSLHPLRDVQVLVPLHKGTVGVDNLNRVLQRALNPSAVALKAGSREFRLGDKVMQLKNNYSKEVYNGDIGFVESVNRIDGLVTVSMGNRSISYSMEELDELMTAYAISVHKSQGSEYPAVVVPILPRHFPLLQRNLLYTAVTRAKRLLVMIGSKKAVAMAVSNDRVARRCSRLAWRLKE